MIAFSRVVNCCRTVLPYAQWAVIAIQLGYAGYNFYSLYQSYVLQVERDARDGRTRSTEEVLELIVKPKRKTVCDRRSTGLTKVNNNDKSRHQGSPTESACEPEPSTSFASNQTEGVSNDIIPLGWKYSHTSIDDDKENAGSAENGSQCTNPTNQNVPVMSESHIENTSQLSQVDQDVIDLDNDDDDDFRSTVSTSLTSTDSNHGIVKDIYSECFICATELNDSKKPVATLPFCQHPFHKSCLDGVLKWHQKCPVCDYHIFTPI